MQDAKIRNGILNTGRLLVTCRSPFSEVWSVTSWFGLLSVFDCVDQGRSEMHPSTSLGASSYHTDGCQNYTAFKPLPARSFSCSFKNYGMSRRGTCTVLTIRQAFLAS